MFQKRSTKKEPLKEIHFKALHRLYCDPADFNQILYIYVFYSFHIIGKSFVICKFFLDIPIFPLYNLPKSPGKECVMLTFGLASVSTGKTLDETFEILKSYAKQAKEAGCTALCFPECFLTGYLPKEADSFSVSRDSHIFQEISNLSKSLNIDLLVGFMERTDKHFFITHGIFLSDGSASYYQKTHLGEREKLVFTPGNSLDIFTLSCGVRFGMQICVETHYNDITQSLSLRGARLIFAPHAVPKIAGNREKIWNKYIPTRSYDNQLYFACCNLWDEDRFGGGVLVTTAKGDILTSFYEDKSVLHTFHVEESEVLPLDVTAKRKYYFPATRRPELY